MINCQKFHKQLEKNNIDFFTGVPDSLLKSFCAYIKDNVSNEKNIVAANEGNAIGLATGYYLATKKIGLVYMQNSGEGNIINPLASLADKLVYSIPMLLVIGWRGEPGKKDEPQHKKQGLVTTSLLDTMNVKYDILSEDTTDNNTEKILENAYNYMSANNEPYALVIKKGTFEEYKLKDNRINDFEMSREEALEILIDSMKENSVIVSTTGMASREVFEIRERRNEKHNKDFLTVGSMGHASQIALGIALNKKEKDVYCVDGDGALIMHMGGMAIIGQNHPQNLKHVIINNGAHDSVGGQETAGLNIDIAGIAKACGYNECLSCSTKKELREYLERLKLTKGPILLEIKVKKGARKDLGRPTTTPIENKEAFMQFLEK
jgi:phosphonopyruvate decarboxylase